MSYIYTYKVIFFLWLLTQKKTRKCFIIIILIILFLVILQSTNVGMVIQRSKIKWTHKCSYLKSELVISAIRIGLKLCAFFSKNFFLKIQRKNQISFSFVMFMSCLVSARKKTGCMLWKSFCTPRKQGDTYRW